MTANHTTPVTHAPVILVSGADAFFVEDKAQELIQEILPGCTKESFALEKVQAQADKVDDAVACLGKAQEAMAQTGFFAEDKIVWLRNLSFAGTDRTSKSETVKTALDRFRTSLQTQGVPAGVTLLITSCTLAKNTGLYKTLSAMAREKKAEIYETGGGDAGSATQLLGRYLEAQGRTMSAPVMTALVSRVGLNGNTLRSECDKLFLYTDGKEPTVEDVNQICSLYKDGEAWDLADAFGNRDLSGALRALHTLLEIKTAPVYLISILEARINDIALLADARERGMLTPNGQAWAGNLSAEDAEAVRDLGMENPLAKNPYVKSRLVAQALRWNRAQTVRARMAIVKGHENLVSVSVDPAAILEVALSSALSS